MSRYPAALAAHLGRPVTSVCNCWRLTRKDGVVFGFTDHDLPLTVDGTLCRPETGFAASEARRSLGLGVDTVDVEGAVSSGEIDAADIAAGKFDGAVVESFLVNWSEPTSFARIRKSTIAKLTQADGHFVAELQSAMRALDRPNGRHIGRACDAELGDVRCGVNLALSTHRAAGTVMAVLAPDTLRVSGLGGHPEGWFSLGRMAWTSGTLAETANAVRAHWRADGDRLTLEMTADALPSVGDTFTIVAGCDKSFDTCRAKFSNGANFRGFPHLPGNDDAYAYVTENDAFDGGALVL